MFILNPIKSRRRGLRRRRTAGRRNVMRRRLRRRARRPNVRRRVYRRRNRSVRRSRRRARRRNTLVSIYPVRRRARRRGRRRARVRHRHRANPIFNLRRAYRRKRYSRRRNSSRRRYSRRRRNPITSIRAGGFTGLHGPFGILPSFSQGKGLVQIALGFGVARAVARMVDNMVLSRLPIPSGGFFGALRQILAAGIGSTLTSRFLGRTVGGGFSTGAGAAFAIDSARALFGSGGALPLPVVAPLLSDYETVPPMQLPSGFPPTAPQGMEDYVTEGGMNGLDPMTGELTW